MYGLPRGIRWGAYGVGYSYGSDVAPEFVHHVELLARPGPLSVDFTADDINVRVFQYLDCL
jgi:hypothetical protein